MKTAELIAISLAPLLLPGDIRGAAEAENENGFVHERFEDFAPGRFGNSGQNLFATRDGRLMFVNWFDLDRDGYPEIVINNDHDPYENVDAMIYTNRRPGGIRSVFPPARSDMPEFQKIEWMRNSVGEIVFLPALGGGRVLVEDLNGNGYADIVFPNFIHGWAKKHLPALIYWGGPDGYSVERRSELPTQEARAVDAGDLSGNGLPDLVVANYGMEYHASETFHGDQYESWVYWQDDRGFDPEAKLILPTEYALDTVVGDVTGDGKPDVLFLNSGPQPSVRVFSSGKDGLSAERYFDLTVLNPGFHGGIANRMLLADLNRNGHLDLVVTSRGDRSEIFWNHPDGLSMDRRTEIETVDAVAAAAGDLNGNGWKELVFANHRSLDGSGYEAASYVYEGGPDGYSGDRRLELETSGATAAALGDVTGNGFPDLVFANQRSSDSYDISSYLYIGSAEGIHPDRRSKIGAFGPVDVKVADLDGDGRMNVFFMNRHSGTPFGGAVPSYVFWGNEAGVYGESAMTRLPIMSGYSSSAGDLNGNGRADLVFTTRNSLTICYSSESGYTMENAVVVDMPYRGMTTNLADLNGDGYLDILVGGLDSGGKSVAVLYGKEDGFSEVEYFDVDMPVISSAIGDLSGDGRLDIVLGGRADLKVFPLDENGRPETAEGKNIRVPRQTQRLALADLNRSGYLDIVAAHYRHNETKRLTVPSAVYWNRGGAFSGEDRTDLQTYGAHWVSAVDLDGDGDLTLVFSNYHGERMRAVGLFAFEPGADGTYGPDRTWTLPAASSSAHLVADFSGNGEKDILAVNHTGPGQYIGLTPMSGRHGHGSYLYWRNGGKFDVRRRDVIPSFGPHKILNAEPGDIARRREYETYRAPWVDADLQPGNYRIEVTGKQNFRTAVRVFVRTGEDDPWKACELSEVEGDRYSFPFVLNGPVRRIQYKLHLDAGGSGTGPVVERVSLSRVE